MVSDGGIGPTINGRTTFRSFVCELEVGDILPAYSDLSVTNVERITNHKTRITLSDDCDYYWHDANSTVLVYDV